MDYELAADSLTLRIVTLCGRDFQLELPSTSIIAQLKERIHTLHPDLMPLNQRLIYKGRVLENHNTISHYAIVSGHTIQLVNKPPSSLRPPPQPVANGPSAHPAQSLGSFEQLLSAAGLRGGNASSGPAVRPNARVAPPGPNDGLTHIRQGLASIATTVSVAERRDRVLKMKRDLAVGRGGGDSESKKGDGSESKGGDSVVSGEGEGGGRSLEGEGGDRESGESIVPSFVLGQWIDARDTIDQWLEATVLDLRPNEVFICYNGWPDHWNEWIPKNSARLSPFRTKTKHTNHKYLNPCPFQWVADAPSVSPPSDNVFNLIPEVLSLMRKVEPMLQECIGEERKAPDSLAPILDRFGRILGDLAQPLRSLNRSTPSAEDAARSVPPPPEERGGVMRSNSPSRSVSVAAPLPPLRSTAAPPSLREGVSDLTQGRSSSAANVGVINTAMNGTTTFHNGEAGNNTTHDADGIYSEMPELEENYDSVSDDDEPPPLLPASMLDSFSDDDEPPPLPRTAHGVNTATPVVRRTRRPPRTSAGVVLPLSMEESNRRLALRYFRCVDHVGGALDTGRRPNVDIHIHAIVAPMGGQGADQGHQVNGATASSLNEQIQNALNLQLQGQLSGATAPPSGGLGMSAETVARPPNSSALPSGPPTQSNWNGGSVTQAALQSISSRIGGWLGLRSTPVAPSATGNNESVPTEPSTVSTSEAPVSSDAPHNHDPDTRNRVDALLQLIRRELSSLDAEGVESGPTGSMPVTGPGYGDAYTTIASLPGMVDDHDPTVSATESFLMSGDRPDTSVEPDPYFDEMHEGMEGEDGNGECDGVDSDDEMPPLTLGSSDDEY